MTSRNPVSLEMLFRKNDAEYIFAHGGLSEQIQKEVSAQESAIAERLAAENPFTQEEALVQKVEKMSVNDIAENLTAIEAEHNIVAKDARVMFKFYRAEFEKAKKNKNKKKTKNIDKQITKRADKQTATAKSLVKDLKTQLIKRKKAWEMCLIDELRKKYLKKLLEQLQRFQKLERLLSPFFGRTGLLWDMSAGFFKESGFEILETYADLLEKDESLQELARVLGKHSRAQKEYEKELREKNVIKNVWRSRPAFKGQVTGIHTSDNISSALPSELVLFKNAATKLLFEKKFVEKSLLSFKYENVMPEQKTETELEEVSKEKREQKGPIIICVDTSGSMNGTPESIAKTVTFALSKIAIEEKRKCYLISFSTGIETMDLSDFKGGQALEKLIQFLRMSFNGGTDASPALRHALEMLQKDDYKNADVLMISDFVMSGLGSDMEQKIQTEQKKKTDFYSLVIGSSGNKNTIACFNHNWLYDTSDAHATRKLVEQLHELKTRTV